MYAQSRYVYKQTVESVLLNAANEVTTVQWTLVQEPTRNCDGVYLRTTRHYRGMPGP